MVDMEKPYYQVEDDVDLHSVGSGRRQVYVMPMALIGGSCFMLVLLAAASTYSSTVHEMTAAPSTSLVASSPVRFPSGVAVQPGMTKLMGASALGGSSPFKKLAISAIEANYLQRTRDVKVRQGGDWAVRHQKSSTDQLKDELLMMDSESKAMVAEVENAVKLKAHEMAGVTGNMFSRPHNFLKARDMPGVSKPLDFWDPMGLSTWCSDGQLLFFREVELKHGRVAMVAVLGILVGENWFPLFGGDIDVPASIAFHHADFPKFWLGVMAATAIPEILSLRNIEEPDGTNDQWWTVKADTKPGDLGWDPLGLKPKNAEEWKDMQTKELNHGRLAMIATAGMIAQELATGNKVAGILSVADR